MFKLEIIKLFAEDHGLTFDEAKAVATPWELFDTYLRYEGIIGYTDQIIKTFRECFLQDMWEYRVAYWQGPETKMEYVEIIANSCQEAVDKVRGNRTHLQGFEVKLVWKKCGNRYIVVNAWN